MTPPAQHCGHECVCGVLMVAGIEGDRSPCELTGCKHDTRSRPALAAPDALGLLNKFALRVRHEFAQDDEEEYYLSAYDFEDCLDELKKEIEEAEDE